MSQQAYYAADDGIMCASMIDDQYVEASTGLGIFPYNPLIDSATSIQSTLSDVNTERQSSGLSPITLLDIRCAASAVFDSATAQFAVTPFSRVSNSGQVDTGYSSSFSMKMDLGDGSFRCTKVTVNKTPGYRQIISQGYAVCNDKSSHPIERAIVNTTEAGDVIAAGNNNPLPGTAHAVLTSGASWTVPEGVTSIKIWAIGGGGGGAGASASDGNAGDGGGAGGVAYKTFTVTGGQVISYSLGAGGAGSPNEAAGNPGAQTSVTVGVSSVTAYGGLGGNGVGGGGSGGSGAGGDGLVIGGAGIGAIGNVGGGAGGAIGGVSGGATDTAGGVGGQSADVSGLFAALAAVGGYPTTSPGAAGGTSSSNPDNIDGGNATGFGSGGGGAGYFGGKGGDGLFGGGGGGAAGYSQVEAGGKGGNGVIVISSQ
jgi:hypothetical protein